MQSNLIVIATTVVLALFIFISTIDARHIHGTTVSRPSEHTDKTSGSSSACGPCKGSNFSNVLVLRGDSKLYMFVELLSSDNCCDVIAKDSKSVNLLDIRSKRLQNHIHIANYKPNYLYSYYIVLSVVKCYSMRHYINAFSYHHSKPLPQHC